MRLISLLLFASSAVTALSATAQSRIYCCDDTNGTKVCGDYLPVACQGRAYEERDLKGRVSKMVEAPLTAEQQARRDAELARAEEAKKKAAEDRRRTLALLATYSSEKDIDSALNRALAELDNNMDQAQRRLDDANKTRKKLEADKEFYKGKPLPNSVKADFRDNDKEIKAQQAAVAAKLKEMDEVRERFADEKRRYRELTGKKPAAAKPTAPPTAVEPAR